MKKKKLDARVREEQKKEYPDVIRNFVTMSAGLEPTTFGEFQNEPKTNALPLRQDT